RGQRGDPGGAGRHPLAGGIRDADRQGRPGSTGHLGAGAPDQMLLDMLLPVVDGWRILQRRDTAVTVIVVTGPILSAEWAAEHGAAGFLKKPVEEAELLAEVRRVLGECSRRNEECPDHHGESEQAD